MNIFLILILVIVFGSIIYFFYNGKLGNNNVPIYSESALKQIMKQRTQIITGLSENKIDPFGLEVPAILIKMPNSVDGVPVYINNRPLFSKDDLGKITTISGAKLQLTIERDATTGSENIGYYTISDINYEISKETIDKSGKKSSLEIFSCNNLGFNFSYPHIEGWMQKNVKSDDNSCTTTYFWIGARDISSTEFSIKATVSDMVKKLEGPINRNPKGVAYEIKENGVIFYLPSKSVEIEIIDFPKEKTSVLKPTKSYYIENIIKTFESI